MYTRDGEIPQGLGGVVDGIAGASAVVCVNDLFSILTSRFLVHACHGSQLEDILFTVF